MEREQRVSVNPEFEVERKILNSFVLTRWKKNGRGEVWIRKFLLLLRYLVQKESNRTEPAIVVNVECLAFLSDVDEALKQFFLQWATSGFKEKEGNVEREKR